ncbi:MAG TPA: MFS transporter [Xanthobacteraceae bacterium]|jgi:MFS family permease|nr:MFS transporter [Xanthobacteraceae bacterium]
MSIESASPSPFHFRRGWVYVLTLALVTINYMDRSALGVVAQAVRGEFGLSPVQMGYLFSSFLWSYVIFLLPIGIMLDRSTARNINSAGIALWSLAMVATAGVGSFAALLGTRLVMGAGEATSIPSCGRIVREWMPARERGVANVFWSAGSFLGPALGAVVVAAITSTWGWRAAFVALGVLGFVWLACNLIWFDRPEKVSWLSEDERKKILAERSAGLPDEIGVQGRPAVLLELLKSPSQWGAMIAQASGIYALYLLLFWLPSYLQDTRHLTIMKTGLYTAIPWAIAVPASIAIGALSDRLLQNNTLLAGGRRTIVACCVLLAATLALVPFTDNTVLILALFALSLTGINVAISLNLSLVTDLVHRAPDVGKAISLTILSGNLCGLIAPIVTGYIVASLGAYDWALWIAGILLVIGAVAVGTMTRRVILPAAGPTQIPTGGIRVTA